MDLQNTLQQMYDDANWYGYAERKGKRYYSYRILKIAARLKITLTYTPAI